MKKCIKTLVILAAFLSLPLSAMWPFKEEQKMEERRLFDAINQNNIAEVKAIIKRHRVNINDIYSDTALRMAVKDGNKDMVQAILDAKPDLNKTQGPPFETALAIAAKDNKLEIAQMLIKAGAKLDEPNTDTILHNSGQWDSKYTPLMRAAIKGHKKMVKLLVYEGADGSYALKHLHTDGDASKIIIDAMVKPTKKQIDSVVAVLGLKKTHPSKQLIQKDVVKIIGKMAYEKIKLQNKAKIIEALDARKNKEWNDRLLDYLNTK